MSTAVTGELGPVAPKALEKDDGGVLREADRWHWSLINHVLETQEQVKMERHLLSRIHIPRNFYLPMHCNDTYDEKLCSRPDCRILAETEAENSPAVQLLSDQVSRYSLGFLQGLFLLFGSPFIFQGPYFQCFGFIHAKNVNSVCMYVYNNE